MRTIRTLILVALLSGVITSVSGQNSPKNIDISKGWKMQTSDKPEYSKPDFDDSGWKSIQVGSPWEAQGYTNYDGIAWYRMKVIIPSSLKTNNPYIKGLQLSLGKIDDEDISFMNGIEIGHGSGWDLQREYGIPFDLIKWDKENVIAVKVIDNGGGGGLYSGSYSIGSFNSFSKNTAFEADNNPIQDYYKNGLELNKTMTVKLGEAYKNLPCDIQVIVSDSKTKEIALNKTFQMISSENGEGSFSYSVKFKHSGWYNADYKLYSKYLKDTVLSESLITYQLSDRKEPKSVALVVSVVVPSKEMPFDLKNVQLSGYLGKRVNANLTERLLKIDETGILECYYNRPGKQTWVGEYTGKYLHAAARAWKFSGNEQLKAQMDRIVDILISCQLPDGYLGTYLPANYWTDWDIWAHKYNLLGLLSYYSVTGFEPALQTSIRIGDLMCKTFGNKPGQLNLEETGGHVGMASCSILEPMTDLYRMTGNKKYLDFCKYIVEAYDHQKGPKIITTLNSVGKVDKTANAKAYEMMSNFTGIVKLYQLTGDAKLLSAMKTGWNDVAVNKLYITGTCSEGEHFQEDFVLPATNDVHMGEGCVTTTWIQFSQAMYNLTGEAKYIDEIEKAVYNHLLGAENPQTGCVSYYTALQGAKPYRCTIMAHCCLASVPRAIAAIPELVYTKSTENGFNINMYESGTFNENIKTKDGSAVSVNVMMNFTDQKFGVRNGTVEIQGAGTYEIGLRVPTWCKNFIAKVDGKAYSGITGQYLEIERNWNQKSKLEVTFDVNTQILDGGLSYPDYLAVKYGAQVLALDQSLNKQLADLDQVAIDAASVQLVPENELWYGNRVYAAKAFYKGHPISLKLVPFAEAGQTGGEVRTWIMKKH
ncbi:MAG: hypothetical protein GZ094_15950 [Mariniphaga sp.]|nr:hypothetical protein [Mariniphaga sp.]